MKSTATSSPRQMNIESGTWVGTARAAYLLQCSAKTIHRHIDRGYLIAKRQPPKGWLKVSYDSIVTLLSKIEQESREPGSTDLYR